MDERINIEIKSIVEFLPSKNRQQGEKGSLVERSRKSGNITCLDRNKNNSIAEWIMYSMIARASQYHRRMLAFYSVNFYMVHQKVH